MKAFFHQHFRKLALLVLLGCFFNGNAHADAYCTSPYIGAVTSPDAITISTDVPVGSVVASTTLIFPYMANQTCGRSPAMLGMIVNGVGAYLGDNLYDSGIPGLAYKIFYNQIAGCVFNGFLPLSCGYDIYYIAMEQQTVTLSLVKTGPIAHGGVLSGPLVNIWTTGSTGSITSLAFQLQWTGSVNVVVKTPTCTVATPSVLVNLGKGTAAGPAGSTSSPVDFNLRLHCSPGDPGITSSIYLTLTDATNPGNTSQVLSLDATSTAKGVGIQVLRNGNLVGYGPDSATVGNTNQMSIGSTDGNGDVTIPFTARYINTSSTVTAGKANGLATFTFAYQ